MNVVEKIKPISFEQEFVGKILNFSKKRYLWKFEHFDHIHEFSLIIFMLSQKFQILFDDKFSDDGYRPLIADFIYKVNIHDLSLCIKQNKLGYELYINNQLFKPGVYIKIIDNRKSDYIRNIIKSADKNAVGSQAEIASHDKVIFGSKQLIDAEQLLKTNDTKDTLNVPSDNFKKFTFSNSRTNSTNHISRNSPSKRVAQSPLYTKINLQNVCMASNLKLPPVKNSTISQVNSLKTQESSQVTETKPSYFDRLFEYEEINVELYLPTSLENHTNNILRAIKQIYEFKD